MCVHACVDSVVAESDAEDRSFGSSIPTVAYPRVNPMIGTNAIDHECNLRSSYVQMLAESLVSDIHRMKKTTNEKPMLSNGGSSLPMNGWGNQKRRNLGSLQSDKSTTTDLHLSCDGHHDRLSVSDRYRCSLPASRSYCPLAVQGHHVCPKNVSRHDVKQHDDSCRQLLKQKHYSVDDDTKISAAQRGTNGHREYTKKRANSITANSSRMLSCRKLSLPYGADKDAITEKVCLDKNVLAAASVAKTPTTINKTHQSLTTGKNEVVVVAKTTTAEAESTTKTKASNMTISSSLINTTATSTTKPADNSFVTSNASILNITKHRTGVKSSSGRNFSSEVPDVDGKPKASGIKRCGGTKYSKPSTSIMGLFNLATRATVTSGKIAVNDCGLPRRDENSESQLAKESMTGAEIMNDVAKGQQHRRSEKSAEHREDAEEHSTLMDDDDDDKTAADDQRTAFHIVDEHYEQRLRSLERKMAELQDAVTMTTSVKLENYVEHLKHQLTAFNRSVVQLQAQHDQMRVNMKAAAAENNDVVTMMVDEQQHKVAELTTLVSNQSVLINELQDRCSDLERDNRLLMEGILNQSVMMNKVMLRVDTLCRDQMQLTDSIADKSFAVLCKQHSSSLDRPPVDKTHDGRIPKGHFFMHHLLFVVILFLKKTLVPLAHM